VIVAFAFLVESQVFGPEAELEVQRRHQEHGIIANLGAVAGIEFLRAEVAHHFDAEARGVVTARMHPREQRIGEPVDEVAGYEPVRAGVPAFFVLVEVLQVADPRIVRGAAFRPLGKGRRRGVVQCNSLRAPTRPVQGIDPLERLIARSRRAVKTFPHLKNLTLKTTEPNLLTARARSLRVKSPTSSPVARSHHRECSADADRCSASRLSRDTRSR